MASYQTLALVQVMCHIYSYIAGSWSCYSICIHQPSSLLVFPLAFSQVHWFYHGTPLTIEPWHLYESGVMFTVTRHTRSYAIAHILLAAGHILCSLVLLYPLHGMWMLCFYFSIIFLIRLACISSIYSASRFGFAFILFDIGFIYLTYFSCTFFTHLSRLYIYFTVA